TKDIRQQISRCDLRFPPFAWAGKSQESVDFIRDVLVPDVDKRKTAAELLGHPWLNLEEKTEEAD
ncbi:hypothetical protein PROFUN_14269, partial [Planoprotostelium fungivorum]